MKKVLDFLMLCAIIVLERDGKLLENQKGIKKNDNLHEQGF